MLYQRYFLRMNQSSTTHILSLLLALMLSLAVVRIVLIPTDVENAPLKNSHRNRNNNNNSSNRSVNNADTNHNISTKFSFDTNTNNSAVALNLIGFENDYRQYASDDSDAQAYAREKHKTEKTINFNGSELVDDAIPNRTKDAIAMEILAKAIGDRDNNNHSQTIDASSENIENGDSMMRTQRPANGRKRHLKRRLMQHSEADFYVNNRPFRRYAMNFYVCFFLTRPMIWTRDNCITFAHTCTIPKQRTCVCV